MSIISNLCYICPQTVRTLLLYIISQNFSSVLLTHFSRSVALSEYHGEDKVKYRLVEYIYPYRVLSDGCQPLDMRVVEELWQNTFFGVYSEIASRDKNEQPWQQGEVVGGCKILIMQSQREKYPDIVCLLREIKLHKSVDAEKAACDTHRKYVKEYTDNDTHKRGELIQQLFAKTEQHHAYAKEMQYTEKYSAYCKEWKYKRHYHSDKEALYTPFHIA